MEDTILKVIAKKMTEEEFDKVASGEAEYRKRDREIEKFLMHLQKYDLTEEQRFTIDHLLAANNSCNARYSRLAYIQGMKDTVAILKELDLIKAV